MLSSLRSDGLLGIFISLKTFCIKLNLWVKNFKCSVNNLKLSIQEHDLISKFILVFHKYIKKKCKTILYALNQLNEI